MLLVTLNNAGFETVQAEDGVEGLEVLENANPDVIVTDINMPRLDGFGFIEGVRRNEKYRAVPILVLTTERSEEHTSEIQSLMRISNAVFCLKKKKRHHYTLQ